MNLRLSHLLLACLFILSTFGVCAAETIYVSDRLIVTLREVPADDSPTIGTLKSDDPVELLEETGEYYKVRTEDGKEGYIKKQYMTDNRPRSLVIADLEKQIARQKQSIDDLKRSLAQKESAVKASRSELESTVDELRKSLAATESELEAARKELAARLKELESLRNDYESLKKDAGDVVAIVNERERLKQENDLLNDELNALREENAYLLRTAVIKWFLAGAGVLFVGWLVGKSSRRKRRY